MVIPSAKLLPLLLFLLFIPSASPLAFNYDSFTIGKTGIFLEGAAYIDEQLIKLTRSARQNKNVGRATYHQPFLLWETSTGKIADFTTHFTFMIDSGHADGMVFFIAPSGSLLNISAGGGGHLGLPVEELPGDTTRTLYPFVAVEFDIYRNEQPVIRDQVGDHVGIDINSLKSNITTPWNGDINEGKRNDAWISYNSSSKNLSVAFTSFQNGTNGTEVEVIKYLSYIIDLKQYLPDWVIVGFSAAKGQDIAVHKIIPWNFTSTALVDDDPTHNKPESIAPSGVKPGPGKSKMGLLLGLGIAGSLILFAGLGLVWFIYRKKSKAVDGIDENPFCNKLIDKELENETGPRKFSYHELAQATSNFEEGEKLGEGGFGGVYRGFIKDLNLQVAVKRISSGSKQGMKEYASEVRIISRLRHRNLVQLIGWCHEKRELLLVYEFLPNRSLDSHLFKENSLLSWQVIYNIAKGLASALLYLHEEWEQCVLHRDIKSSNVMLDSNFNVKLGDFGLARLVDHGEQSLTTIVAGTRGYMALEYVTTGKSTKESDVYSFGVVSLEIACGRKPIDFKLETSQIELVKWVWGLYEEGNVIQAADPKLYGHFDEKQMECLMIVGLWCAHPQYTFRPSIQQAIQVLNFEVPLPILPSKMPAATYIAPPTLFSTLVSDSDTITSERGQTESSGTPHSLTITPSSTTKFVTPSTTFQSAQ
ncbi:hypothetical protein DVH24_003101 [Malus domestica]|uniref:Protein kinase domain-containing protein n=1 Tax=Malus domestica TaxID=3750 RepID=A0A498KBW2_MALDO|nr:L-type lectin-domain containing receptor kinase IX.1-like [Malus domestica]RXI03023.1 hypothetical protein DVH24_003101 [Malus domestica]